MKTILIKLDDKVHKGVRLFSLERAIPLSMLYPMLIFHGLTAMRNKEKKKTKKDAIASEL